MVCSRIVLCMRSANERRRYIVASSLVGWAHTHRMDTGLHTDTTGLQIDGLVKDCSISSALAMEILQSGTKPSICCMYVTAEQSWRLAIMTSWHGNLFRITGLCAGNTPVIDGFPAQRDNNAEFWQFLCVLLLALISFEGQSSGQWFETLWGSCDVICSVSALHAFQIWVQDHDIG